MQKNIIKYCMIIWLLLLTAGGSHLIIAASPDTVYLESSMKVDLCNIKSEANPHQGKVQLVLDMGEVTPADSLFGYDFQLLYNPEIIALNAPLYANTLTEYMDEKEISFMQDTGMVLGFGITMSINQPVYGNRKLVAMRGDYLGSCPDTSEVEFSYIEFTDEFSREIKGYSNAEIISFIDYSDDRYFNASASNNIDVDSLGSDYLDISVNTIKEHNAENISITIDKPLNNFIIDSVSVLSEKIAVDEMNENDESIELDIIAFDNLAEENILRVYFSTLKNTDSEEMIDVNVTVLDNCTCLTNVQGTEIILKSNYLEEGTSVADNNDKIQYFYNQQSEILRIESEDIFITKVNIYNIQGQLMESQEFNHSRILSLTTGKLSPGLYVYQIISDNNKLKNIFIIK